MDLNILVQIMWVCTSSHALVLSLAQAQYLLSIYQSISANVISNASVAAVAVSTGQILLPYVTKGPQAALPAFARLGSMIHLAREFPLSYGPIGRT